MLRSSLVRAGDTHAICFQDAFIVDAASGGLFVWVGKACTMEERRKAMDWGEQYLAQQV